MPKNRYQATAVLSVLLAVVLMLSACANDQPAPAVPPVGEGDAIATATIATDQTLAETPTAIDSTAIDESAGMTATVDSDASSALTATGTLTATDATTEAGAVDSSALNTATLSGDVEIITDTQLFTDTQVLTTVQVNTDVVVLEEQLVTTVVTATNLLTDVTTLTDQAVITATNEMTETEDLTPTTQSEGVVGGANVVQLTETPTPSATPSPQPTATPTVLVEVTDVVTATVQVTEVVTQTVTDTELVTDTITMDVTPTPDGTTTPATPVATTSPTAAATANATTTMTATDTTTATSGSGATAIVLVGVVDAENQIIRASELQNTQVSDFNQEDVGELNDLIVNLANGRIVFATLESGGFLGLGEETYPMPLSAFRYLPDTDGLILNIDEAQLADTPGFDDDWPDLTDARYDVEVEQFWRNLGTNVVSERQMTGVRSVAGTVAKASNLLDSAIYGPDGEALGEIEDLLIDLGSGEVRYVVVSQDEFLGLGGELHALPLSAFDLDTSGAFDDTAAANLILGVDQSILQNAPAFDANSYPNTDTTDWDAEWRQFWNDNL